jgi:hypothetical protein
LPAAFVQHGRTCVADVELNKRFSKGLIFDEQLGLEGCESIARSMAQLSIAAIDYIASDESVLTFEYPPSAPVALVQRARSRNKPESEQAEAMLRAAGYTEIGYVGRIA